MTTTKTKIKNVINFQKEMPNSIPLEKKCLSQMMNNSDEGFSHKGLCSGLFYDKKYKAIYNIIEVLWRTEKRVDSANIFSMLSDEERKEISISMLSDIENSYKDADDIEGTIDALDEMKARREKIEELSNAINSLFDMGINPQSAVANITNVIELVGKSGDTVKSMREINDSADELLTERVMGGTGIAGMQSGITDLDTAINGFQKKQLMVIAGRPSMGKTLISTSIMDNLARQGHKGLFFSLEQSSEEIRDKIISNSASILHENLSSGQLTPDEWNRYYTVKEFMNDYDKYPLRVDDNPSSNLTHIRKTCEREQRKYGLDYIVIDYLTYMPTDDSGTDNDVKQIQYIVKGLKDLSKKLNICVILLAQLNRQCESREDKRPKMADLRGSGNIEEEADKILFLYRNWKYSKNEEEINDLEVDIAKFRGGKLGVVNLKFEGEYQRVSSWNDNK